MRIPVIVALSALFALSSCPAPEGTRASAEAPSPLLWCGDETPFRAALSLGGFARSAAPGDAEVLLVDAATAVARAPEIASALDSGAVAIVFGGPAFAESGALEALLAGSSVSWEPDAPPATLRAREQGPEFLAGVDWMGAPQARARARLSAPGLEALVESDDGDEAIFALARGGRLLWIAIDPAANREMTDWAYWNYLVVAAARGLSGAPVPPFGEWRGSPVPHDPFRGLLVGGMLALVALSVLAFVLVRRWSKAHPEAIGKLVASPERFLARESGSSWEKTGFHRPLGGFLMSLLFGLVVFVPFTVYNAMIVPTFILPSAQAMGIWGRVTQFFNVFWLFFDWGTSIAFVKFMSEYRVKDPARGAMFGQLFVWWQLVSGMLQATMFVALACFVAPRTALAIYAFSVIAHSMIQVPGFYSLTKNALQGFQRFDYSQIIDVLQNLVFPVLTQVAIVVPLYAIGSSIPSWGSSMTGLVGMGVAAYVQALLGFLLGLALLKRLGYGVKVFFMAHFDRSVVKEALRFGMFEMLGSIAWAVGQALEIALTQERLANYNEVWANWGLAWGFVNAFGILMFLYSNVMPSISESISRGKAKLSAYYEAQSYKWGGFIGGFLGGVLLAVGPRFVLGASGPWYERAAAYLVPLTIFGVFQFGSWVGDNVALGANRPWLKPLMVSAEQVIRLVGAWIFIDTLQVNALIVFYLVGLVFKGVVFYLLNDRLCFRHRFYAWQTLVAPAIAGGLTWLGMTLLGDAMWRADPLSSVLYLFIGLLPAFVPYAFLHALAGGHDDGTLAELAEAAEGAGFMRSFARLYVAATRLGARLSPLHGRFPLDIRAEALAEAEALDEEKVRLA